jgi:hypothetical protein
VRAAHYIGARTARGILKWFACDTDVSKCRYGQAQYKYDIAGCEVLHRWSGKSMDLTLRQVRYFVAVAEAGKLSLAGLALGVSQSTITVSMQALEAEAGIKLVKRHSRGVDLTHEGYQFLSHARRILAMVSDAAQMLRNSNTNLKGVVRLGVTAHCRGLFSSNTAHAFPAGISQRES